MNGRSDSLGIDQIRVELERLFLFLLLIGEKSGSIRHDDGCTVSFYYSSSVRCLDVCVECWMLVPWRQVSSFARNSIHYRDELRLLLLRYGKSGGENYIHPHDVL